jgi:NAD(P)-dependent dehydrogenase (short-subunit alcohol dehydrogenase family)
MSLFTPEEWEICIKVLKVLSREPEQALDVQTLKGLVTKLHKNARKNIRKQLRQETKKEDLLQLAQTILYQQNPEDETQVVIEAQENNSLSIQKARNCYICKKPYSNIHFFYHQLCPSCADFNYEKRFQTSDLTGRTALITGGRIKIGYLTAIRMLRDGAKVLVTTRFPKDAALRFYKEPDFEIWKDRLHLFGLDLRNIPATEALIEYLLKTEPRLDILINNAAQTVKRPLPFYKNLLQTEQVPVSELPVSLHSLFTTQPQTFFFESESRQLPGIELTSLYFPEGKFDKHGQAIDLRPENSWILKLDEVDTVEMLEVHLVNAIAPFLLTSKLKKLFLKSDFERKFIVNVSAMEGQFNRKYKTVFHPHTNMAKAALNMLTRTSANDFAKDHIYMNSVDTGWITQENPFPKKSRIRQKGFVTPLDETDGMARIYDPIAQGINLPETPVFGHFLKDYFPFEW